MLGDERAASGHRLAHRNPGGVDELPQRGRGLAVDHAAAGDDQRPARGADQLDGARQRLGRGRLAVDGPGARLEERAGTSNASDWTSSGRASVTAPVSAGSVSTRIASSAAGISCSGRSTRSKKRDTGLKQSLTETSRRGAPRASGAPGGRPRGERVAREQQDRQAVDRRQRRAGHHVRRPRADRASCTRTSRAGFAGARSRPPCGPSPARCAPGGRGAGPRYWCSACPRPATLPWPKIPRQPAKKRRARRRARPPERRGTGPAPGRQSAGHATLHDASTSARSRLSSCRGRAARRRAPGGGAASSRVSRGTPCGQRLRRRRNHIEQLRIEARTPRSPAARARPGRRARPRNNEGSR